VKRTQYQQVRIRRSPRRFELRDSEAGRPSDEGFDASDQWFRISKVREPVSARRSSWFDSPTGVPKVTQTPERVGIDNSPSSVNGTGSGRTVGPRPFERRGWVRIGPNSSPGVVLEDVHGHERLLQPQVILCPGPLSTNSRMVEGVTHSRVGTDELRDGGVPSLVGSPGSDQYITELLTRRGVVHHDAGLHVVSYGQI